MKSFLIAVSGDYGIVPSSYEMPEDIDQAIVVCTQAKAFMALPPEERLRILSTDSWGEGPDWDSYGQALSWAVDICF